MALARQVNNDTPLKAWGRALAMTTPISKNTCATFPTLIENLADKFGTAPALLSQEGCLSYRALTERSNRYSRWALARGIAAGDVVCLLMLNCPDYMAIWLGVTRIGAVVSLVNTNLVGSQLEHAINLVSPRHVIVGGELIDALAAVTHSLPRPYNVGHMVKGATAFRGSIAKLKESRATVSTPRNMIHHPSWIGRSISIHPAQAAHRKPRMSVTFG